MYQWYMNTYKYMYDMECNLIWHFFVGYEYELMAKISTYVFAVIEKPNCLIA